MDLYFYQYKISKIMSECKKKVLKGLSVLYFSLTFLPKEGEFRDVNAPLKTLIGKAILPLYIHPS